MSTLGVEEIVIELDFGLDGPGVASGGATGQALAKVSSTNYDTEWVDVLNPDDIGDTVQAHSDILDGTTASYTVAEETKLGNLTLSEISDAQTAADNAQTAADNAQQTANNAQTAADNAQNYGEGVASDLTDYETATDIAQGVQDGRLTATEAATTQAQNDVDALTGVVATNTSNLAAEITETNAEQLTQDSRLDSLETDLDQFLLDVQGNPLTNATTLGGLARSGFVEHSPERVGSYGKFQPVEIAALDGASVQLSPADYRLIRANLVLPNVVGNQMFAVHVEGWQYPASDQTHRRKVDLWYDGYVFDGGLAVTAVADDSHPNAVSDFSVEPIPEVGIHLTATSAALVLSLVFGSRFSSLTAHLWPVGQGNSIDISGAYWALQEESDPIYDV